MSDRTVLEGIAPAAWEHPADRAALNTLRSIPGFDEVVRRILGFFGERGIRHVFLANAVRVGPRQRPALDALLTEVLETLDWPERPELYVTQTPELNAGAVGFERPFIVLNSGALGVLGREEQRVVLGHELGHIMSGHATYRTVALLFLLLGTRGLPFLTGLALLPVELALLEWYRKSELSSDRAGLLASQDVMASMRVFLTFAGGAGGDDELNVEEFLAQAAEYEEVGSALDSVVKLVNVAFRTHPFNTVRAAELQRWVRSGEYERVRAGAYPRRGEEPPQPLSNDYSEAAGHYADQARAAMEQAEQILRNARDAFVNATRPRPR